MAEWLLPAGYVTLILGLWVLGAERRRRTYVRGGPTLYAAAPYRSGRWQDRPFAEWLLLGGVAAGIVVLSLFTGESLGLTVGPFIVGSGFATGLGQFAILAVALALFALYHRVRRAPGTSPTGDVEFREGGIWWPGDHIAWRSIGRWSLSGKDGADELLVHDYRAMHRSHTVKLAPGQEQDVTRVMRELVGAEPAPRAVGVRP